MRVVTLIVIFLMGLWLPHIGSAQSSLPDVYTVTVSRVIGDSLIGVEIQKRADERQAELQRLDEEITAERTAEEQRLTGLREEMSVSDFAVLAQEFDEQTQENRARFENLVETLQNEINQQVDRLRKIVDSEIERVANERNGATIIDSRYVLYAPVERDLTELIIARLDAAYQRSPQAFENAIFANSPTGIDLIFEYNNANTNAEPKTE